MRPPSTAMPAAVEQSNSRQWLWIGLGISVLLIVFVIFVLPYLVTASARNESEQIVQIASTISASQNNTASVDKANKAVEEYLKLVAELTLNNAHNWGDGRWQQATASAKKADSLFAEGRFNTAIKNYMQASSALISLQADRDSLLNSALTEAAAALESHQINKASEKYEHALAINEHSEAAQQGLKSSKVRGQVLALMEQGKRAENNADLSTAKEAYYTAFKLDQYYSLASQRLQEVRLQISQRRFRQLMSKALVALDKNKISMASNLLSQAAKIRPNDPAVHDAVKRLSLTSQQNRLDDMRTTSNASVQQEDWQAAIDTYQKALNIESNAAFAASGLIYARQRLSRNRQFDIYINQPTRLYSPEPLANAQKLIAAAVIDAASEPKLFAKQLQLKAYITQALTPLPLILWSDENTDVVIYHVGKLGRFKKHQVNLKPGEYTIVGIRSGYRDVRKLVKLLPGQTEAPIVNVRCEEKI